MRAGTLIKRHSIAVCGIAFCAVLLFSSSTKAQDSAAKWSELGYPRLPEGFPDDDLTLFEGLNLARGKWTFEGVSRKGKVATPVKAELQVKGSPKGAMYAGWIMSLSWPAEARGQAIQYTIIASPSKTGFKWGLFIIDAALSKQAGVPARPPMFEGNWNPKERTMTWTEKVTFRIPDGESKQPEPAEDRRSFQLVVTADGHIEIKNAENFDGQHLVTGKAIVQTGKAPEDTTFLAGKHQFKSADMVADPRIKPYLPPTATDIMVFSERGGHFARYKVSLDDFTEFLDELWKKDTDDSAHERDEMHGEGKAVSPESMARFRKVAGWEPLQNAVRFYGPSKSNGAMTTFYYDRATGTVYHDRGYW